MADDELLTVLAHGWLNMIAPIAGYADLLAEHRDSLPSERSVEILSTIAAQAHHMEGMLREFVDAANPEVIAALEAVQADGEE
jgi:hypothetical protein